MSDFDRLLPTTVDRDVMRWATVTALAPLRIKLDGESTALPFTPDSVAGVLAVNNRVWVALATNDDPLFGGRRVVVLGKAGGFVGLETLPYAKLQRLATQNLADNTNVPIEWDTAVKDTHGGWAASPNPSRYTGKVPGEYRVYGVASWSANSTARRAVHVLLNGTGVDGSQIIVTAQAVGATSLFFATSLHLNGTTDYVEINEWHIAGTTLTTATGLPSPTVNIEFIRP